MTPSLRRRLAVGFLGLLVVLAVWRHVADARQTRALWAVLGTGSFSMELLWDLSEARPSVKRAILAATLRQEFDLYPHHILNAAVGLHPDGLALLLDVFRSECGAPSLRTKKSRMACVALSAALPSRIRGGYLVQALAASSDVAEIQDLARSLGGSGIDDTLAWRHISRLLATAPPKSALPLIGALDALGAELSRREADRALDILSSTEGRLDPELLRRVRQRAGPAAVARARARVLACLREPSSSSIANKVRGLQALGQELPAADAAVIASNVLARYRVEIARDPRQTLVRTYVLLSIFESLQRDVPAEILEDAARGFAARTGRHGCDPLDPRLLRPVWAKLPPVLAQDLRRETLRRLLAAEEPAEAFCLGSRLASWDDLPPGDAVAAWRRLFGMARFRIRPGWARGDAKYDLRGAARESLAGIAARLPPDEAAKAWRMITGGEERRDPFSQQMLTASLPSLGKNLPPASVAEAGEALLPLIRVDDEDWLGDLLGAAAALGPGLPAATRHKVVELSVAVIRRRQPDPACVQIAAVAAVAGPEELAVLLDLLKWPNCSALDRLDLVQRITQLTGTSFGQAGGQAGRAGSYFDRWALAAWARREGYRPEVPPRRGPAAREDSALWAGSERLGYTAEWKALTLWGLSAERPGLRREVLERAFEEPQNAVLFLRDGGRIVHTAVGFQPAGLSLLRSVLRSRCGPSSLRTEVYRQVCVLLIEALPPREIPAGYLEQALIATSDPAAISRLAGLLSLTGAASPRVREHIGRLLATTPASDADSALLLFRALATLGDPLPARVADQALDALDVAQRWRWFSAESDLRLLRRLLPRAGPAAVARARARLIARLRTDLDPPVEALVPALRALGQELAPAETEEVAARLLSRFWDQDLRWSSSVAANARRLLASFDALHREVPAETLEGIARAVFSRIDRPGGCFLDDPEVLRPLWARLFPAVAAELRAANLQRLMTAGEPSAVFCLGTALAAWDGLPPGDAAAAWKRLSLYKRFQPSQRSLAALAPAPPRRQTLKRLVEAIREDPEPACGTAAENTGPGDLGILTELMQWPTCPPAEREALARKITQITGKPFGREDGGGTFYFDRWAWADWARQQGFLLAAPPRRELSAAEPLHAELPAPSQVEPVAAPQPTAAELQASELLDWQDRHRNSAVALAGVRRALPDLLWLDRLTLERRRIEVEGHAFYLDAVASFLEYLDRSRVATTEPVLRGVIASGDATFSFSLGFDFGPEQEPAPLPPLPLPTPRHEIPGLHREIRAQSDLPVQRWVTGPSTLEMRLEPVTYAGTLRFLSRLSCLSRLAVIERLTLTPDLRDTRKLVVDLELATPAAPDGTDLPAPRKPAAGPEAEEDLTPRSWDPFWDLRQIRTPEALLRGHRPPGIAGLLIDDLRLLGIRRSGKGYAARVKTFEGGIYLLRQRDQLYDGDVVSVSTTELVFKQIIQDPAALKPFREVVKRPSSCSVLSKPEGGSTKGAEVLR